VAAARRDRVEESRDSNGHGAGEMLGRGDLTEQCNREQTADGRDLPDQARVKRCGKSAPAHGVTRAARQTPPGARSSRRHGRPVRPVVRRGSLRVDRTDGWPPAARCGRRQDPAYRPTHRHLGHLAGGCTRSCSISGPGLHGAMHHLCRGRQCAITHRFVSTAPSLPMGVTGSHRRWPRLGPRGR
jgi:hypothetical protein